MKESILIVESADMPSDSNAIFDRLMKMLESTGCIKDKERTVSDLMARDWAVGAREEDGFLIHHSKTEGVSRFCAAVLMFPGNIVHGIFAWPENTDENLQKIAAVFDRVQKMQLKKLGVKAA